MKSMKKQKVKVDILIFLCLVVVGCFVYHIISYSALVKGLNPESDQIKNDVSQRIKKENIIEGAIIDHNGIPITTATEKGEAAELLYHSYATIIGYNDSSGSFGLRDTFSNELYSPQDSSNTGATIRLTTDCTLQERIYTLLMDRDAAAVVLENNTGRILALVSTSGGVDFDMTHFHENYTEYESAGYFNPNATNDISPPGSSYKVITVASVIETGRENVEYNDNGVYILPDGSEIHNDSDESFGSIAARTALVKSCNTYFASYAVNHRQDFIDISERFLIGKDIPLDFTTLHSTSLSTYSPTNVTAMSGFGQGAISLSPLQLAMITQSLANNGSMMKPYLIDSIYFKDKTLYEGKPDILCSPITESVASVVSDYMSDAAESYGAFGICAKTGTADLDSGLTHTVYISFNDSFTVVVTENGTSGYGSNLQADVLLIYEMLDTAFSND